MEELKFTIYKNRLTIDNPFRPHIHPAADTVHYLLATFEFDPTWDGFEKRVYFKNASYNIVRGVLLGESNTCYIPWEVLAHTGVIRCNVIGLKYSDETVTQRITTNPVVFEILVDESILEPYDQQPLTPTEYEQFRITFENVYSSTVQARDAAIDAKDIAVEIAATLDAPVEEAEDFSKTSEAYAVGTRGGVPVDEDDDTYQNNSKYYSELAKDYVDNILYALPDIVDNWLDEHPEATTTVEDGAITYAKLGSDINKVQVVNDIDELKTSVAPYVYVINNNSRLCDLNTNHGTQASEEIFSVNRNGCWYWTHSNNLGGTNRKEIYGGYLRENGDVMFAMPNQGDRNRMASNINGIFDVFASYFDRNDLEYGQVGTLFMDDCVPQSSGRYYIDCTSFVSALIQGVYKYNSRYDLGDSASNIFSDVSSIRLPSSRGTNLLYLDELTEYFAENKQLFTLIPPPSDGISAAKYNNLQPGDLLFSCAPNATGEQQDYWNTYYASDHVTMVVQTFAEDGKIVVAQAGGTGSPTYVNSSLSDTKFGHYDENISNILRTVKLSVINFDENIGTHFRVFARPSYTSSGQSVDVTQNVSCNSNVKIVSPNSSSLGYVFAKGKLKKNKLYSVVANGTLPRFSIDDVYLVLRVGYRSPNSETTEYYTYYPTIRITGDGDTAMFPFIVPASDNIDRIMEISVLGVPNSQGIDSRPFALDNIAIYEGYQMIATGTKPLSFTKDSGFANSVTNLSMVYPDKIFLEFKFNAIGTANSEIHIGKINDWYLYNGGGSIVIPGILGATNTASLRISQTGDVYYATSSTSTGAASFVAWI